MTMKVMCAILFLFFSFLYLYEYQADILAVAQHVLSDGQTHYNRTIGAVLITAVLYLLQIGVYAVTKLSKRTHAMTYFPSLLILAIITDISPNIDLHFSFGAWLVVFPLLLILYGFFVWACRQFQPYEADVNSSGLFSRMMWINVLTMSVMFMLVGMVSNHNDVFHYRMHIEQCLLEGKDQEAVITGSQSLVSDSSLTMLRAYALSRTNQLGDKLFEYPIVGNSESLLPNGSSVRMLMYPEQKLYAYLGMWFKQPFSPMHYLTFIERHHVAKKPACDYLLCGYLMDKNLDAFVHAIGKYYDLKSASLPKHYREALILYTHLRSHPVIVYHSSVMDADFQDYQDMENKYADKQIRKSALRNTFGNTYWYYYQYQ